MAETVRLIKKYPNRRLYDTRNSCYITLADVKQFVISEERFSVVDAKSGEDLTRSILLQIILEEESGGTPMFTHEVLSEFIRFYGNAMQGFMGEYLQRNIQAFVEFQKTMQPKVDGTADAQQNAELWAEFLNHRSPAMQDLMSAYMEHSRKLLEQMQRQFQAQNQRFFANLPFAGIGAQAVDAAEAQTNAQTVAPSEEAGR